MRPILLRNARERADDTDVLYLRKRLRWTGILALLTILLGVVVIFAAFVGIAGIPFPTVAYIILSRVPVLGWLIPHTWQPVEEVIVMDLRMPRVLLAALVGGSLSLSGAAMQGVFRNPMADPYIIGISAGAGLGAVASIVLDITIFGAYTPVVLAFAMGLAAAYVVCMLASIGGKIPVDNLLLSGIAVGSFLSAGIGYLTYRAGERLQGVVFWLLGGFWGASWEKVGMMFPVLLVGCVGIYIFARDLNVFQLSEEDAHHAGIDVERSKRWVLGISVLCTAVAVAFTGIIGFVGLVVPHIMRMLTGPDHRVLIPACILSGAVFLTLADTAARSISAEEFPVGMITAFVGAPFFIYLLVRRKRGRP